MSYESINPHRLYRNPDKGILFGICAGIADYLNISRTLVRLIIIIGAIFLSPFFWIGYIALIFILKKKPANQYRSEEEAIFWRSVTLTPKETFADIRHKYRTMNERMRKIEDYVTSSEFELEQKYKNL
ncbi:MAG: envelope stress response membrane protein PspC [Pseudomonadota bacterium]